MLSLSRLRDYAQPDLLACMLGGTVYVLKVYATAYCVYCTCICIYNVRCMLYMPCLCSQVIVWV